MTLYRMPPNQTGGPVGRVEVQFEYDDGGTPPADPPIDDDPAIVDDVVVNVYWRNPNPEPASMVITFLNNGRTQAFILSPDTPEWQTWPVPANLNARRGRLAVSGPNYPATVL